MRNLTSSLIVPFAFLGATSLVACSFQMQAGSDPKKPTPPAGQPTPPPTTPSQPTTRPSTTPTGVVRQSGKPRPTPSSSQTTTPTTPPTPPPPPGAAVVTGTTIFGGSTVNPAGFKGNIYWINPGTTTIPDLTTMKPVGYLFTSTLNVTPQAFTSGFPGIDAARKEQFIIRYEAPLVVVTDADYDFRVVAEDGAKLTIDGMAIVENEGIRTAPAEKTAPVHLVPGTHILTVDYMQTTGNVALQVFCKKAGGTEVICPTNLQ